MPLRYRIVLIFGLAAVLLTGVVTLPLGVLWALSEADLEDALQDAQHAAWRHSLNGAAVPFEQLAERLQADAGLLTALDRGDRTQADRMLADLVQAQPAAAAADDRRVVRIDVLAQNGHVAASSAGLAAEAPLLQIGVLSDRNGNDRPVVGLEGTQDGHLVLLTTLPMPDGRHVSIAGSLTAAVRAMGRPGRREAYLLDRGNTVQLATEPRQWAELLPAHPEQGTSARYAHLQGRWLRVLASPALNSSGTAVGTVVTVQDVTAAAQRRTLVLLLTGAGALTVCLVLCVGLYGHAHNALDPLSEVTRVIRAMAAGDVLASAEVPLRRDEVGDIAQAVEVFRRNAIELERVETREALREAQQEALIRRELGRLAEMLEEPARSEMLSDLAGIEAAVRADPDAAAARGTALVEAFRRMAGRVVAQHRSLADLLDARTRDLAIVQQALAERGQLDRLRQEMQVAHDLQMASLPATFPPFPGRHEFEIYAAMQPAKEVGGDFYDFTLTAPDQLALLIGDAAGKGVPAAMFIAMARSLLRSALARGATPAQALELANATLAVENASLMFATIFVAVLDLRTGALTYANAGHNPPLAVLGPAAPARLDASRGVALGVLEAATYQDCCVVMRPDERLVLFTDGVTEANTPDLHLFGDARLNDLVADLAGQPVAAMVAAIQAAVRSFAGEAEQADDITVMALRFCGPGSDALALPGLLPGLLVRSAV